MENNVINENGLLESLREEFALETQDLNLYSPLVLAYMGDCIYELIIRTILVERKNCAVQKLHKEATWYVKAASQAKIAEGLLNAELLSEEELSVYKRGRNAKSHTVPKHAEMKDYRKATGLEALLGYLFLKKDMARVIFLVKKGLAILQDANEEEKQ